MRPSLVMLLALAFSSCGHAPAAALPEAPAGAPAPLPAGAGPAYPWRGLMIDCARHPIDLDFLRRAIRVMAAYKLNVLHLHLVDNEGWAFETRAYPKCNGPDRLAYTQEHLRDLVAFAARHGVEIVPEFDFPGHSRAAVNAYPELDCEGKTRAGGKDGAILCAGKAATWTFLEKIVAEAAGVFPSTYFHIGADEPFAIKRWASCPDCQARMKKEGAATLEALYHTFLRDVHAIAAKHGKTLVVWDDAVHPGVEPMPPLDVVIHGWKDFKTVKALARAGYRIVNSSYSSMYFTSGGLGAGLPIEAVCMWDPRRFADPQPKRGAMEVSLSALPEGARVLGGEACCWATDQDRMEQRLYPRLLAAAEILWTGRRVGGASGPDTGESRPEAAPTRDFLTRIAGHLDRLRALGVPVSEASVGALIFNGRDLAGWVPVQGAEFAVADGSIAVTGKGGPGRLRTEKAWRDFALSFDWKADAPGYDSGVFIRCAPGGDPLAPPKPRPSGGRAWPGLEVQIAEGDEGHGAFGIADAPAVPKLIRSGDWNTFEIVARGPSLTLIVNGKPAWTATDPAPQPGHIAFQAEGSPIRFRNVRLRELVP